MGRDDYSDVLRSIVHAHLPGYRVDAVVPLGEGLDNVAFEVNGELIVRFRRERDAGLRADLVDREVRVLAAVAGICPVPTPLVAFAVPEHGCLAYVALPGRPLLGVNGLDTVAVARRLGEVLLALHTAPVAPLAELVDADDFPLAEWLAETAKLYAEIGELIPPAIRDRVLSFVDDEPPDSAHRPVFSHNDLGIEHVLVDPATSAVTGIIDWSDAAIVDPAYDFGLILRDLGPSCLDTALRGYPGDVAALRVRALFHARCAVLEDLAFGVQNDQPAYVDTSVAALSWLFPA